MSKSKTPSRVLSKDEAMELLSHQMRRPDLEDATLVKLMTLYSKLARWGTEPTQSTEEPDMDKLIAAVEKKRKSQ